MTTKNWPQLRSSLVGAIVLLAASTWIGCGDSNASRGSVESLAALAAPEARLRVKVDAVRRASLTSGGSVTGTVRAFHRARITAETQGRVLARAVEPGAALSAGDVLVELESSRLELELRRSNAALAASRTVLAHAKREFDRGEMLVAESAISAQRRDDLRLALDRAGDELALARVARDTAKRDLEDARIVAPFDGTVDSIDVSVGDFVSSGTPVATMVDLSRVRIFGGVTAREAARLRPGTNASVSFADLGGRNFESTLRSVSRVANPGDGTYEIELWMDNSETLMRDGLVARIELPHDDDEQFILVRREALLRRAGRPEVFVVVQEAGRMVARSKVLRTGRSDGEWIEIVEGLESGDRVVYDGHFALEDGSVIEIDEAPAPVRGE
jgi:membrane fusion protein, multidrug efflux system